MGSGTSDLTLNIKAQARNRRSIYPQARDDDSSIYELVDIHGGGFLVDLTKTAIKTKNFNALDNFINSVVIKYLLNKGKCEHVKKY